MDPALSSSGFARFYYRLRQQGLEWLGLYYGTYRAEVIDNEGPEGKKKQGIITVRVPAVGDSPNTAPRVAYPKFSFAGPDYGSKFLPPKGGFVWVEFENGRPDVPIWTGGWFGVGEMPVEMQKTTSHGFKTPGGHSVLFSDEDGNQFVRITWHKPGAGEGEFSFLELTKDGGIAMSNKKGASIFLNADGENLVVLSEQGHSLSMTDAAVTLADKDGNVISIDGGAVTVLSKGEVNIRGQVLNVGAGSVFLGDPATFSAVLGELLLTWLATHTHGTGVGPSSPPIVPPPPTLLSKSVKVKP